MKYRLDKLILARKILETRSQAENYIRLGKVFVDGFKITKPGYFVKDSAKIELRQDETYVSRAGLKLASVAKALKLNFYNKVILDVGSSTGGFTDFSLRNGAKKVIAVDVGTNQLHPSLRCDSRVELHEKTDIRNFTTNDSIDIILIDVSFISIREILPSLINKCNSGTQIIAMFKPQFEAGMNGTIKGVVKNNTIRRKILHDFEQWCRLNNFFILDKKDSEVRGQKGNQERFYKIKAV